MTLRELVQGRSVALVGPAASLLGRGLGPRIDAADLVVRMNLACPVPPERHPDAGSRTDVLYHTLFDDRLAEAAGQQHTPEQVQSWVDDGVRIVVTRQRSHGSRVRRVEPLLRAARLPLWFLPDDLRKDLWGTFQNPSMGTIAIAHLLSLGVRSLFVTGMDFFESGYYPGYGGFDEEQAARGVGGPGLWGQLDAGAADHRPHPQPPQKAWLREMHARDRRLHFDEVAEAALGLRQGPPVTALVPMKGHSERVANKNRREVAGRPLLYWTLSALSRARRVHRVVVDTDSDGIEQLVRSYFPAVEVLRRPEWLEGGGVSANELIGHDLTQLEGEHFLQTHVTSPLVTSATFDRAVEQYFAGLAEHDSLFGVTELRTRLFEADGEPLGHDPAQLQRTQDLQPVYLDNSALYVFSRASFTRAGGRIGATPAMFPVAKTEAVDIDDEDDLRIAEALLRYRDQGVELEKEHHMTVDLYSAKRDKHSGLWAVHGQVDGVRHRVTGLDLGDSPTIRDCTAALRAAVAATDSPPEGGGGEATTPAATPAPSDADPLAGTVAAVAAWAKEQADAAVLEAALERELADGGGNRVGVVRALEGQIELRRREQQEIREPAPPAPGPDGQPAEPQGATA